MSRAREFKWQGKRYVLDTFGLLQLARQILTDTEARFSRGDRGAVSAMLEPLLNKIVAIENEYDEREHARQQDNQSEENKRYEVPHVLFHIDITQEELPSLLHKLRREEPFPLKEILPNDPKRGEVFVKVDGHTTVLFDATNIVRVRAFLIGTLEPMLAHEGNA